MNRTIAPSVATAIATIPTHLLAHGSHEAPASDLAHFLWHAMPVAVVAAGIIGGALAVRRLRRRQTRLAEAPGDETGAD